MPAHPHAGASLQGLLQQHLCPQHCCLLRPRLCWRGWPLWQTRACEGPFAGQVSWDYLLRPLLLTMLYHHLLGVWMLRDLLAAPWLLHPAVLVALVCLLSLLCCL